MVCIILGIFLNVGGWIGNDIFRTVTGFAGFGRGASRSSTEVTGGTLDRIDAFAKVEGEVGAGSVEFVTGKDYSCVYENYPKDQTPEISLDGTTLKIKQKARNNRVVGDLKNSYSDAKITISIPEKSAVDVDLELKLGTVKAKDVVFGDVELDADMGSIELENCTAKDLDLTADMGAIEVTKCTFDGGKVEAKMGGIDLVGVVFDSAEAKADMGGLNVQGTFNKFEAKCSMGGINVESENEDAKLSLSSDMGGISVNGKSVGRSYNS